MNVLKKILNIILFSTLFNFYIKSANNNIFEKFWKDNTTKGFYNNNDHYIKEDTSKDIKTFYNLDNFDNDKPLNIHYDTLKNNCFFLDFTREVKEEGGWYKGKKNTYNLEIKEKKFKIEFSELLNDIVSNIEIVKDKNLKKIIENLNKLDKNKEITFRELCNNFNINDCKVFLNNDYFKTFNSFKNFSFYNFFNIVLKGENTFFIDIDKNYKISGKDFDFYEYNITSRNPKIPPIVISNSFYKINNINKYLKNIIRDELLKKIEEEDIKKKYKDITEEFVKKEEIIFLDKDRKEITDLHFDVKDNTIFFDFKEFYEKDKEFQKKYEEISNRNRNIKIVFIDSIKIDENNGVYIDKKDEKIKKYDFITIEKDDIIKGDRINEILKDQINSILKEIDELYKNIDENNAMYKSYDLKKELFKYIIGYNFKITEFDKKNNIKNEINKIFLNKNSDIKNKYENSIKLINELKTDDFIKEKIEYNCNLTENKVKEIIDEIKKEKNNIILNIKKELFLYLLEDKLVINIKEIISNLNACTKENILEFSNNNINEFINNKGYINNIVNVINKNNKDNKNIKDNTLNNRLKDIYNEYTKKDFNTIYNNKLQEVFTNEKSLIIANFGSFLKEIENYKIDEKEILDNLKTLNNLKIKIRNDFQNKYNNIISNYKIYENLEDYINLKDKYKDEFNLKINKLNSDITNLALSKEGDENVKDIKNLIDDKYTEYNNIISGITELNDKNLNLNSTDFYNLIKSNNEFSNKIKKIDDSKKPLIDSLVDENFNLLLNKIKTKKEELKISFNIVIKDNKVLLDDFKNYFRNVVNKYKNGVYENVSYSDLRKYIKEQFYIKTDNDFNLYNNDKSNDPKASDELIKKGSTIYIAFANTYYVKTFEELEDDLEDDLDDNDENSTDDDGNNKEQDDDEGDGVKIIKPKQCSQSCKKCKK